MRWYNKAMVQLLTLSACQTALGDRESELGFAGLAIGAGVKSALASFWKVDDLATLALMSKFYEELRSIDITVKAEALQAAQLAMLRGEVTVKDGKFQGLQEEITLPQELLKILGTREKDLSHPFYWSSFTMIGSPW